MFNQVSVGRELLPAGLLDWSPVASDRSAFSSADALRARVL